MTAEGTAVKLTLTLNRSGQTGCSGQLTWTNLVAMESVPGAMSEPTWHHAIDIIVNHNLSNLSLETPKDWWFVCIYYISGIYLIFFKLPGFFGELIWTCDQDDLPLQKLSLHLQLYESFLYVSVLSLLQLQRVHPSPPDAVDLNRTTPHHYDCSSFIKPLLV